MDALSNVMRPRAPVAAGIYVVAWLVGLVVAPPAPGLSAPARDIHSFFLANGTAAALQSGLVHGIAGIALAFFIVAITRSGAHPVARVAGVAAAGVSLAQVVFMQMLARNVAGGGSARVTERWFEAINRADSVKLLLLGVTVGAVTAAIRSPRSMRWLGVVLAPLLPLSGAAFLLRSETLYLALYVSLPLLLIWMSAAAFIRRGARRDAPEDTPGTASRAGQRGNATAIAGVSSDSP